MHGYAGLITTQHLIYFPKPFLEDPILSISPLSFSSFNLAAIVFLLTLKIAASYVTV